MVLWLWLIPIVIAAVIGIWALFGMVSKQAGERSDGQIVADKSLDER